MDIMEVTGFANANPVAFIATVDGDQPRVRAFAMWYADETGFYFHTGSTKDVCQQLRANPKVELCFFDPGDGQGAGRQLRVEGTVEFLEDPALAGRLYEERPWVRAITAEGDTRLAIFRVAHGAAWFWTMAVNLHEREQERVRF
ncbi:MAG: pyridoxamine 5'-phosphate oxidase [Methanospirillum sp.]|nr:pyridoxamine 5'-phosphate oxidase [Methanospirillum sp.]